MALKVGELFATVKAENSDFKKVMKDSENTFKNIGKKIAAVGKGLTASITLPIVGALTAAVKLSSDMGESLNKVDVAFKTNSASVKEWSGTTLKSFGIAKGTALDMAALYGDMGTAMGQSTTDAAKMSTSLVGLAGDLASFKNIGVEQARMALRGIYTGEGESLKELGVVMQESTLQAYALASGFKTKYKDMDQAAKVALRYAFVMDATKNAQGDFARTSGGAANQFRIFSESLKEVGATIGNILLPYVTQAITMVNGWIQRFGALDTSTQKIILVVAGVAAAIGPVLIGVGALMTALPALGAVFAVLTGPVGIAVAAIAGITAAVVYLWNTNKEFRDNAIALWTALTGALKALWTTHKDTIIAIFKVMWEKIQSDFNSVVKIVSGIMKLLTGLLTGDWKKAWEGAKEIFNGVWQSITGSFKGFINLIIIGLNALIKGLNKVHFEIPSWVPGAGGKKFGINIPQIPKLASGGIVDSPTLAMIGEGAESEAVAPLSKLYGMIQDAVRTSNNTNVSFAGVFEGATLNVRSQEDVKGIARELYKLQTKNERGRGYAFG